MPEAMERALMKTARKRGSRKKRKRGNPYGTPKRKKGIKETLTGRA